ncbi:hypothetical protein BGW39_001698 [Mortierella sp. 14UC]|nr:hypothetical protein BGW39_001698 [Mortierella sp. 14UC]
MSLFQLFRLGNDIESLALRMDANGTPYNQMTDIQDIFPGALRFKVNGNSILFLENQQGQRYEPNRIAYYPNDIIEVVCAGPAVPAKSYGGASLPSRPVQWLSEDSIEVSLSELSVQSYSPTTNAHTLALSPQWQSLTSIPSPNNAAHQAVAIACSALPVFSAMTSNISHLKQQLLQSTDQHSTRHQQLLHRLIHMEQKLEGMLREQVEAKGREEQMLREQAESKEREEQMLREQAESKKRDEQILVKQQETIDHLIVAQQRLEAVLVQNYELHEYPIPRLFVILPDSYERWDPRNFMAERFRLYFLCECGDHCKSHTGTNASSGQLAITAAAAPATRCPIPVKNTIHLAKHEGYELSRPNEFFDRYGPYVLGMLRVLKHCLAVATVVAPAVALADNGVKDVMDGVKSLSESTQKAVDISINFLERKLDDGAVSDGMAGNESERQNVDRMLEDLAALEGADLRRLDSFLRNKDADKILGNLYRITTETGHVKWVCLDHYRQVYRETTMTSFLQCVETNGGTYDPQVGKVTIALKSSTAAKDFFSRLSSQASFVIALKVALNWSFGSSDLVMAVDKIAKSSVQDLELDLQDFDRSLPIVSQLRPGKGRYHTLLSLLSNTKLKDLTFANIALIGPRTSSLPSGNRPSHLQSFHFLNVIRAMDDSRLASLILHCPGLVDLRLGSFEGHSDGVPAIDQVIGSLSKLKILHRIDLYPPSSADGIFKNNATPYGSVALRELAVSSISYPTGPAGVLEDAILRSSTTLEVLALTSVRGDRTLDLALLASSSRQPFARLIHLDISVHLTPASFWFMASILPKISLSHLQVNDYCGDLLAYANPRALKTVSVDSSNKDALKSFYHAVSSPKYHIEFLVLNLKVEVDKLRELLHRLPLRWLALCSIPKSSLEHALAWLNLSRLETLTVICTDYCWEAEAILAARSDEFLKEFMLQLPQFGKELNPDLYDDEARDIQGSTSRLSRLRVRLAEDAVLRDLVQTSNFHVPSPKLPRK